MLLLLFWGGLSACAQDAPGEQPIGSPAPLVREIRIILENGSVLTTNPGGITVKVGEALNLDAVAASIRALYQTGDYADIRALRTAETDGIRLDFVVRENLFINEVLIQGLKPPPSQASAVGSMQLALGQTYREGDLEDAIARLQETLREDGL